MILSSSNAQPIIKILQFDKNTGIIDKGEDAGLRVGDIFDVNRYAGDFVYWIGRVEVVVVKSKVAGIKMLAQAENARFQPGDVLESRQRDAGVSEKKNQAASSRKKNDSTPQGKIEPAALNDGASPSLHAKKVIFGLAGGLSRPLKHSSQSLGLNFSLHVRASDNKTRMIDMTHAYTTSFGFQGYCTIPLSNRLSANLNYGYLPLNVKSAVEADLLRYGMKASASVMKVSAALEGRIDRRVRLGWGAGLFLPQVTINNGRQSITVSERHFGFAISAAHLTPLGPAAWLRSIFEYNIFLDKGPAIHYVTMQTGLSIGIGKN
ncbi:MAG: hypothetical protein ONB46_04050 [candidate division KSB1 bacterium]|nr:hypothetical protein [candidate division KSB1 bacterium]MDZ7365208.1 hypothetical protein [candidate division KSB1 bacterium]MDZ7406950.1 hypothetical protein [candidate division KSB1 bacterium]